jgi:two-component system sensor histidine kinase KdpD
MTDGPPGSIVDESPDCRRALRRAASLSSSLRAPLLAVALESPSIQQSRDRMANLQANIDYAVDLGAEVIRGEARDLARGLSEVIDERRVEHLVLVRKPRGGLSLGPSLAERLMDANPSLEIHLVNLAQKPGS